MKSVTRQRTLLWVLLKFYCIVAVRMSTIKQTTSRPRKARARNPKDGATSRCGLSRDGAICCLRTSIRVSDIQVVNEIGRMYT
ncbi:hypothetical protein EV702DRAFT_1115666 [Suillus placidus]|uniref:Secreted protein n=1 Tax=Suillus placidus TaxID=48579 RepID=A0A9P6ZRW3_9AGAM|nr:hypothetical protein EV702DRAFT_1115666 [Suillus placidus]